MRLLIDTNRYRDFCVGIGEVLENVRIAERIYVSFVTLAELRAGFICGTLAKKNERGLNEFLSRPRVSTLFADHETTHHYARLYSQLRRQGTPIPTNDLWIAALAMQHSLFLYSRDTHFDALPQLLRVD